MTSEGVLALACLGGWLDRGAHLCETEEIECAATLLAEVGLHHFGERIKHSDNLLTAEFSRSGDVLVDGSLGAELGGGSDLCLAGHCAESFRARLEFEILSERQAEALVDFRENKGVWRWYQGLEVMK